MAGNKIKILLRELTAHDYVEMTTRGNAAITVALATLRKDKKLLIPEEGGWLHYKTAPEKLGLEVEEVRCHDAKIDLEDLEKKLQTEKFIGFLYQNPGGYFAEQPMKEIYALCKKYGCLVILDVSGSLGTHLCNGKYADFMVGSFGKWKLVEARVGGFISAKTKALWDLINLNERNILQDETSMLKILQKIEELPERIGFLQQARTAVIQGLDGFSILYPEDLGFVIVVRYSNETEKEKIINYCSTNSLEWTECPRYIRINDRAISIEIKRLQ